MKIFQGLSTFTKQDKRVGISKVTDDKMKEIFPFEEIRASEKSNSDKELDAAAWKCIFGIVCILAIYLLSMLI